MSVSREDVRHIAALARLNFSEDEEERLVTDMSRILDYVEQLREIDVSDVPPMAHALDVSNVFRDDVVTHRITRDDALGNAPDSDEAFVRVPKVIS